MGRGRQPELLTFLGPLGLLLIVLQPKHQLLLLPQHLFFLSLHGFSPLLLRFQLLSGRGRTKRHEGRVRQAAPDLDTAARLLLSVLLGACAWVVPRGSSCPGLGSQTPTDTVTFYWALWPLTAPAASGASPPGLGPSSAAPRWCRASCGACTAHGSPCKAAGSAC